MPSLGADRPGVWRHGGQVKTPRTASGREGQDSQSRQGRAELVLPGPALREMQGETACFAGDASGQGEEASSEGLGGHYLLTQTDVRCPAGQVCAITCTAARRRWRRSGKAASSAFPGHLGESRCGQVLVTAVRRTNESINKAEGAGRRTAKTRSTDALRRVLPTTVSSYLQFRGWICQETLCDQSSVTFDLR